MPDPVGKGKVKATVIAPADPGRKPRFAWVRLDEGDCAGENERVSYDQIERMADTEAA